MKKLLIIDKSFDVGGIQTSLINLCLCLKDYYEIDLLMYYPEGELKGLLPREVKIIEPSWRLETLGMSFSKCMEQGTYKQKCFRIFSTIWTKILDNRLPIHLVTKHQKKLGEYDVAIAYHHEAEKKSLTSGFIRIMAECVEAKKKISWIHNDTGTYEIDEQFNDNYYNLVDEIVAVSKSVMTNFVNKHPKYKDKVSYCYNFLDYNGILEKSKEIQKIPFPEGKFICFSACRLTPIKGIVRAITTLAPVFKEHQDILWFIAGDGSEKETIKEAIRKQNLEKSIILIGSQTNPYCYMKNADLIMLLSYHEAAPMLYSEARFLGVPIFTTEISSSREMLDQVDNAYICENNEEGILETFLNIIKNQKYVKEQKKRKFDNAGIEDNLKRLQNILQV